MTEADETAAVCTAADRIRAAMGKMTLLTGTAKSHTGKCTPNRKKKRKRTFGDVLRFLLMIIALGVFLYSGWTLYGFYQDYKKGSDEYDNLESSYARTGRVPGITMHSMMTIR